MKNNDNLFSFYSDFEIQKTNLNKKLLKGIRIIISNFILNNFYLRIFAHKKESYCISPQFKLFLGNFIKINIFLKRLIKKIKIYIRHYRI